MIGRVASWWRRLFPQRPPLDPTRCYASVEDAFAGTWSCLCGAREGDVCPVVDQ